jgi:hypothetical protein
MYEMAIKFRNVSNGRYYHLCLYQDLLGDWIMSGYRGGRYKHHAWHKLVVNFDAVVSEVTKFIKTRLKHGYT